MMHPRLLPLVLKYIVRHRARTLLTLSGIAMAMFLFVAVQAMQKGVDETTRMTALDTTLVVYRENRFCPFTSQLPQHFTNQIASIPGVVEVTPMRVVVNNCRASLDVVTFRGIPEDANQLNQFDMIQGSLRDWSRRNDAALVGERLAQRRDIQVGDRFDAAGITVHVAGIIRSENPQDQNVAYVHLNFLQLAAGNKLGVVTQFNVRVQEPSQLDAVAASIDEMFATSEAPTWTTSEKAFIARAITDIVQLVEFTGWLGIGSLVAVFALVANAIAMSVQDRVKDHAVMQTLGYPESIICMQIVAESLILSVLGGVLGISLAVTVESVGRFSFSADGLSVNMHIGMPTILLGLGLCAVIGIVAGMLPALRAARLSTTEAFRAV